MQICSIFSFNLCAWVSTLTLIKVMITHSRQSAGSTAVAEGTDVLLQEAIGLLKPIPRNVIRFLSSSQEKHSVPEYCHRDRFPLFTGKWKSLL